MATKFCTAGLKVWRLFSFVLGFSFSLLAPAFAQTNPVIAFPSKEEAYYAGNLNETVISAFIAEASERKVRTLIINSSGGPIRAGVVLAHWVFANNVHVVVDRLCMSSCANYVFAAGKTKTIRPNALVIWHGGARQKNFREDLERYRKLLALKTQGAELSADDSGFLEKNEKAYPYWEHQTQIQHEFFEMTQINEYVTRVGQEPEDFRREWTLLVGDMEKFGLKNVLASPDYGTVDYVSQVFRAAGLSRRPISLTIDKDGKVVNLTKEDKE